MVEGLCRPVREAQQSETRCLEFGDEFRHSFDRPGEGQVESLVVGGDDLAVTGIVPGQPEQ